MKYNKYKKLKNPEIYIFDKISVLSIISDKCVSNH